MEVAAAACDVGCVVWPKLNPVPPAEAEVVACVPNAGFAPNENPDVLCPEDPVEGAAEDVAPKVNPPIPVFPVIKVKS